MKTVAFALIAGALALVSGCAHEYMYVPVGPGAAGGPAARYPIPPYAPQGEVYVTSFGFTDLDLGPGRPGTMLHTRLAVSNGSPFAWTVDGRQQVLVTAGQPPQGPAFLNTDAGAGPIYQVLPGRANVFDLYFAVPPPLDQAQNVGGFALDWNVNAGGQVVAQQTSFQRYEGEPASYAPYPAYVAVGLGFGVGWWYGPLFAYHYGYPPAIRGYYYPPAGARGGPWRGRPPSAWRGSPPATGTASAGWRGTPPASGGSTGGWRGTPPTTTAPLQAAPRPSTSAPAPAPRPSSGWGHGGGRGFGRGGRR
jgi:hypothetical protein